MLTKSYGISRGFPLLASGQGPTIVVPPVPPVEPPSGVMSVLAFVTVDDAIGATLFDFSGTN